MQSKVALYCRLSKEDADKINKGDDSESIQNQKLLLMEYAMKQGWQLYAVYTDDDRSGLDRERPAFKQMLSAAEQHAFDIVLCKNQSRFSRDMEIIEKYLHNLFPRWKIRFIGLTDHADTGADGGKKARQINGLINEWYCEDLSANVTAALAAKKRSGQYLGHWCTYGYALTPDDRHKIQIDPAAASVVREIYRLYLSGYGVNAIAQRLTEQQYPPPSVYKQAQGKNYHNPAQDKAGYAGKYGVWAVSTIRRILRDETYLGHLIQGREKTENYKTGKVVRKPPEEWIVVKNNHAPIIEAEIFYQVQKRLGVKSAHRAADDNALPKTHLLAGKVFCMDCGSAMQKRRAGKMTHYLKCGLALKTKNRACSLHTVRMDCLVCEIEKRIRQMAADFAANPANAAALWESYKSTGGDAAAWKEKNTALAALEKQKTTWVQGLTTAYVDRQKGQLSEVQFALMQQQFDATLARLEREIAQAQADTRVLAQRMGYTDENISAKCQKWLADITLTHETANALIDRVYIGEKNAQGEQSVVLHWLI